MSLYKLFASTSADGAASLDIVLDGIIEVVQWAAEADIDADGEGFRAELSFSSTSGFSTNDTKSSVSTIRQVNALLTSGAVAPGINMVVAPLSVPVRAGERMYLHTAGVAGNITCHMYVKDKESGQSRRVRL